MLNFLLPVLGSVIASRSQKKQQQQQQQYAEQVLQEQRVYDRGTLQRIREDALESGFNPLSVLRNGGVSIGANTYLNSPALSSTDFIGQSLMQAIDTGFNAPQRELDAETQRLQNDLYRAQIGELQANTDYLTRSHGFGIPAVESYGVSSNGTAGGSDSVGVKSRDDVVAVSVNGNTLRPALGWSDAQEFEDRYGDVASAAYGFGVIFADLMNSRVPNLADIKPSQLPANVNTVDWISGGWKN
jgi:type II secretory pathway pseudopilin PulG